MSKTQIVNDREALLARMLNATGLEKIYDEILMKKRFKTNLKTIFDMIWTFFRFPVHVCILFLCVVLGLKNASNALFNAREFSMTLFVLESGTVLDFYRTKWKNRK